MCDDEYTVVKNQLMYPRDQHHESEFWLYGIKGGALVACTRGSAGATLPPATAAAAPTIPTGPAPPPITARLAAVTHPAIQASLTDGARSITLIYLTVLRQDS